jgi:2,4-dienoyl-CoA reductase-like NADH-dependent reductase (Old Yellow Enzyme family)
MRDRSTLIRDSVVERKVGYAPMSRVDLFGPFSFRNGERASNRIALAPMTTMLSHADGSLSNEEHEWLLDRAEGGFRVIETCAAHVALDGQSWEGQLGIYSDALLAGLETLASTLFGWGADVSIAQLFHGGAHADPTLTCERPWSAVEIPSDANQPRAATTDDIERVIDQFRAAAVRAHKAGFDGVELHGAHGHLLCQFLSRFNIRTDGWGNNFEGRARLIREVARSVRGAVPASFVVGVRISPEDWGNANGLDLDESLRLAKWLCDDGIDYLHLSLWMASKNTKKRPNEHPIPLFRAVCPGDVPIFVAGNVWTRAEAEALLELGADVVALGRAAIANPDWPRRAVDPAWEPTRPLFTAAALRERGLSEKSAGYMRTCTSGEAN